MVESTRRFVLSVDTPKACLTRFWRVVKVKVCCLNTPCVLLLVLRQKTTRRDATRQETTHRETTHQVTCTFENNTSKNNTSRNNTLRNNTTKGMQHEFNIYRRTTFLASLFVLLSCTV